MQSPTRAPSPIDRAMTFSFLGPQAGPQRLLIALATCASLFTSSCTSPQGEGAESRAPIVGEGGRVVGLSGSYSYREDDDEEREWFALRGTIDQFLTDEHVVGAYVLGQFSNQEDDPDGREQLWAGVHYHYHYHLNERTAFFAGPSVGLAYFDDESASDGSFTYGISGGVRHWLTERAAFTLEPTYLRANFDDDAGDDSQDFLLLWGLAFSL